MRFDALSSPRRMKALQAGQVDVVLQTLAWTQTREVANGLEFAGINFYDGQSFLVRKSSGVKTDADLKGAAICTTQGSTSELNLADWSRTTGADIRPVVFDRNVGGYSAYDAGRCDAYNTDASQLAATRTALQAPDDHVVPAVPISNEPLGPAVRKGDEQWLDIGKRSHFALINAEELGITRANVDDMLRSPDPAVQRLLGVSGDAGKMMGLDNRWAYFASNAVGTYAKVYDRHFGPIGLARGPNALWTKSGLMYAPPVG